ncbi:MAG: carbohydrate kinase family protein [Nanoarchaeota archaeon]
MKKFDVITIGSASIDLFLKIGKNKAAKEEHHSLLYHLGEKLPVEDIIETTGGGATNTAVAFSRLGLATGTIISVGSDENGKKILKELRKEGISFLGTRKKGKTGTSIILPGNNDRTILVYSGVNNELETKEVEKNLLGVSTDWLYVSTLRGKGLKTIDQLTKIFRDKGTRIAMNISMYLAKKGLVELKELLSRIDVLIMNKEELLELSKTKNFQAAMEKTAKVVKGIIIMTDGPKEIKLYNSITGEKITKKVEKVKVVDSTGAGDAFSSGFTYAIIKGETSSRALIYGIKEAKEKLKGIGAKSGLIRRRK